MQEIEVVFKLSELPDGFRDWSMEEVRNYLLDKALMHFGRNAVVEYHYPTDDEPARYIIVFTGS